MKVLIAPLNWGLGHASRCIPLVIRHLRKGDEVVLAGDGDALLLLRKHFPGLRYYTLAPLQLRYSAGSSQVRPMLRALPKLIRWARKDHTRLQEILAYEMFGLVISDNRFGCFAQQTRCVYITHQLHVFLPQPWRWLEGAVERLHCRIAHRFNECWVPDYEGEHNLSGDLSHHVSQRWHDIIRYIGPLSRFDNHASVTPDKRFQVVAVLSGLEPQRTLFEQQIVHRWLGKNEQVLIVRGLPAAPTTTLTKKNIAFVPYLADDDLAALLLGTEQIIARSGYSSIMDLHTLHLTDKARLIPTPGQPEQEYLATLIHDATATIR